LTFSNN